MPTVASRTTSILADSLEDATHDYAAEIEDANGLVLVTLTRVSVAHPDAAPQRLTLPAGDLATLRQLLQSVDRELGGGS